jgi:8-oxo-dGTP diphosphatase
MDRKDQLTIAAAVIVVDRSVLLIRRRVTESQLVWQFPAGKVEPGEAVEDAVTRETLEEVGLRVTAVADLGGRTHPQTPGGSSSER